MDEYDAADCPKKAIGGVMTALTVANVFASYRRKRLVGKGGKRDGLKECDGGVAGQEAGFGAKVFRRSGKRRRR